MEVKTFEIKFSDLAKEYSNRFDCDFLDFSIKEKKKSDYPFNKLFDFIDNEKIDIKNLGTFNYAEIGNVDKSGDVNFISLDPDERNELNENYFKKIEKGDILKPAMDDILISSVRPNLKKFVFIDSEKSKSYFTRAFIHLRAKSINARIIYYALRSIFVENLISITRQGKGYPTLKNTDLKYIYFDKDTIKKLQSTQDQAVAKIKPIENKIKELKAQIKNRNEIINKVFVREFRFDLEEFLKLKRRNIFKISFASFNNNLFRSTTVFNCPASQYLRDFFKKKIKSIYLKKIITEKIHRGKQPVYSKSEDVKVIKTINIKEGKLNFNEVQFVSNDFYKKNQEKATVKKFDLLLTSTGMGRGKFALYEEDETVFADSHISIIRFNKKKINPSFLSYFCQSILGIEQLKYIEMQIKGTPEIYETQFNYLQIPNTSPSTQQKIVNEIKTELDKQEGIRKGIEKEREKIDEIITRCIK